MFFLTTPKRALISLVVCQHLWGCASAPSSVPIAPAQAVAQQQALREAFDPSSIREDLLLIQPNFPRLSQPLAPQQSELSSPPITAPLVPTADVEQVDLTQQEAVDEPVVHSTKVFRVQLLALSNEQAAQQLVEELTPSLNASTYIQQRNQLYMVQAGDFATREAAQPLLGRVRQLGSDYGDAYIVSVERQLEMPHEQVEDGPVATSEDEPSTAPTEESTERVRTFGWRVLLDQFLSYDEADQLRNKAMARLNRRDIDVTFKAPWYKVEVGHFADENEAQTAAEKIKSRYPNALKVRAQVLIPKRD